MWSLAGSAAIMEGCSEIGVKVVCPMGGNDMNAMESFGFIGGHEVLFDGGFIVGRGRHFYKVVGRLLSAL